MLEKLFGLAKIFVFVEFNSTLTLFSSLVAILDII